MWGELTIEELMIPIKLTLLATFGSGILFAIFGPIVAYYQARSQSFLSKVVGFVVTLPLVFPPIALGYILLIVLGKRGMGDTLNFLGIPFVFSPYGVVFAAFIAGLPLAVKPIVGALQSDRLKTLEFVSKVHGVSGLTLFTRVTMPLIKNQLFSGLLLGMSRASGEVGITMMIGGNLSGETNTLSLEIFNAVSRADFDSATMLCILLSSFTLILYLLVEWLQKRALKF